MAITIPKKRLIAGTARRFSPGAVGSSRAVWTSSGGKRHLPHTSIERAEAREQWRPAARAATRLPECRTMDRRLANRNLRTALIAGAISMIVFAASFVAGLVY